MRPRITNLASQTAIYGISAILSKFLNYMLTPYFTNIMGESVYGEVTLFYALIPFVNVLLTMGFATAYFRWSGAAETFDDEKRIFTTLWGSVSTAAIIFFTLCWLFQDSMAQVLGYEHVWYSVLIAGLIAVDNINAIPLAALRGQGRAVRYTVVNVTSVLVNVVACVCFYTFIPNASDNPSWVLVSNLIASCVSTMILVPSVWKLVSRTFSPALLKKVFLYSYPLMLAGLMGVGGEFLDRYMIEWILPADVAKSQVGIYGAVAKVAALMLIFRQIYTLGAEPFFLQKFSKEDFKRTNAAALKYFTMVGLFVCMLIWLYSDWFQVIIGVRFRVGMSIVPILLIANLLLGVLVNLSFWYKVADKTRYATFVTMAGLTTTIICGLVFIPRWGYVGAAWAHLSTAVVMVVLSYIFNQVHYKVPYQIGRIGMYAALAVAICAVGWWLGGVVSTGVGNVLKFLLLLCYVFVALKVENVKIMSLWKKIQKRKS